MLTGKVVWQSHHCPYFCSKISSTSSMRRSRDLKGACEELFCLKSFRLFLLILWYSLMVFLERDCPKWTSSLTGLRWRTESVLLSRHSRLSRNAMWSPRLSSESSPVSSSSIQSWASRYSSSDSLMMSRVSEQFLLLFWLSILLYTS